MRILGLFPLLLCIWGSFADEAIVENEVLDISLDGYSPASSVEAADSMVLKSLAGQLAQSGVDIDKLINGIQTTANNGAYESGFNLGQLVNEAMTPKPIPSERTLISLTNFTFPTFNHTLSSTCSNQYCEFLETSLSCKALTIHMTKLCAQYLLGALFGCDVFPSRTEIFNAPFACTTEFVSALKSLQAVQKGTSDSAIQKYVYSDFTTNCPRRCFQRYISQGNDLFYGEQCRDEMQSKATKSNYLLSNAFWGYRGFRNQICVSQLSPISSNCFKKVQGLLPTISAGTSSSAGFACQPPLQNNLGLLAMVFSSWGCCYGSIMSLVAQNPSNTSSPTVIPPCLFHYVTSPPATMAAFAASPFGFCTENSNSNLTAFKVSFQVAGNPTSFAILSVFTKTTVLALQAAFTGALLGVLPTAASYPYYLSSSAPLNVQVIDYAYYDATGASLFPGPYTPSNYSTVLATAVKAVFTVELVIQGFPTAVQNANMKVALSSPYFVGALTSALGKIKPPVPFTASNVQVLSSVFTSYSPTPTTPESAGNGLLSSWIGGTMMVIMITMTMLMGGWMV